MTFTLPGDAGPPPTSDRPAADMATMFKNVCVDAASDAATGAAAAAAGLSVAPAKFPFGPKAPPINASVWSGPGVTVSRTEGFFAAPLAQCNATFYVETLPGKQEVADAVSRVLGAPPANLAEATDKNGKPKRFYAPIWKIAGDQPRIVSASVSGGSQYTPGAKVQLSIYSDKKGSK